MIESVVATLAQIMQDQLPAQLAQIEGSFTDGVVLDPPAKILTYEPSLQEVPERPLLLILAGQSRPVADTGLGGGGWADYEHLVLIAMVIEESDPYILSRKMLRTNTALVLTVGANRTSVLDPDGVSAWQGISITGTDPGERFQQGGTMNAYVQTTMVTVKATRTEA